MRFKKDSTNKDWTEKFKICWKLKKRNFVTKYKLYLLINLCASETNLLLINIESMMKSNNFWGRNVEKIKADSHDQKNFLRLWYDNK